MICSLDLSQHTKKFEKRKFVLSGSSNGPLYIWTQTTFVGRRWGREHGRIGADVRLLYGKRKMKGREVNVLKRRKAGEITQSLIVRNRKRAKGSKPGKKALKPGMHGMGGRSFFYPCLLNKGDREQSDSLYFHRSTMQMAVSVK